MRTMLYSTDHIPKKLKEIQEQDPNKEICAFAQAQAQLYQIMNK